MIPFCNTDDVDDATGKAILEVKQLGAELRKMIVHEIIEQLPRYVQEEVAKSQAEFISGLRQEVASCVAELNQNARKPEQTPEDWKEEEVESKGKSDKLVPPLSPILEGRSNVCEANDKEMNAIDEAQPTGLQAIRTRLDVLWEIVFTEIIARREAMSRLNRAINSPTDSLAVEPEKCGANASFNDASSQSSLNCERRKPPACRSSTDSSEVLPCGPLPLHSNRGSQSAFSNASSNDALGQSSLNCEGRKPPACRSITDSSEVLSCGPLPLHSNRGSQSAFSNASLNDALSQSSLNCERRKPPACRSSTDSSEVLSCGPLPLHSNRGSQSAFSNASLNDASSQSSLNCEGRKPPACRSSTDSSEVLPCGPLPLHPNSGSQSASPKCHTSLSPTFSMVQRAKSAISIPHHRSSTPERTPKSLDMQQIGTPLGSSFGVLSTCAVQRSYSMNQMSATASFALPGRGSTGKEAPTPEMRQHANPRTSSPLQQQREPTQKRPLPLFELSPHSSRRTIN